MPRSLRRLVYDQNKIVNKIIWLRLVRSNKKAALLRGFFVGGLTFTRTNAPAAAIPPDHPR